MLNKLNDLPINEIKPWYRHFNGSIEKINDSAYITKGCYRKISDNKLEIYELPIGQWSDDYKQTLETLLHDYDGSNSKKTGKEPAKSKKTSTDKSPTGGPLKDYKNYSTETEVHFVLEFMPGILTKWEQDTNDYNSLNKIEKELKLSSSKYTNMSNMYLFNEKGAINKYNSVIDVMEEFYHTRLVTYQKRRLYQLNQLQLQLNIISAKYKFILEFINDELVIIKRKKIDLYQDLETRNYPKYNSKMEMMKSTDEDSNMVYYNYLVKMSIDTLTEEKLEELSKEIDSIKVQIDYLENITPHTMWKNELNEFSDIYDKCFPDTKPQTIKIKKKK